MTHEAKQTAADQATHGCTDCGKRLYTDQTPCPECGSVAVIEIEGGDADSATGGAETSDGTDGGDSADDP